MFSFEKTIFINRPAQEVFDLVTDPSRDALWRPSAISSEWATEGPPGVGSIKKEVGKLMGRKMESATEVTHWESPNLYGNKSVGGPIPFQSKMVFESRDNGTQLTFSGQAEIGGFFKIAEGLAGRQLEKVMDSDLKNLKAFLEGGGA